MAETRAEFANAVQDALDWLGMSPEDAAPLMGLNSRTLGAMCQGIVPMRSLIIRFAAEMGRLRQSREGAREWWGDVDAWLQVAGYPPRREGGDSPVTGSPLPASHRLGGPAGSRANGMNGGNGYRQSYSDSQPPHLNGGPPPGNPHREPALNPPRTASPSTPFPPSPEAAPASEAYHPRYERMAWGDSFVHVFWILDRQERRVFQIRVAPNYDYKARAAEVKRDLAALSRTQFERKYGRFRVDTP